MILRQSPDPRLYILRTECLVPRTRNYCTVLSGFDPSVTFHRRSKLFSPRPWRHASLQVRSSSSAESTLFCSPVKSRTAFVLDRSASKEPHFSRVSPRGGPATSMERGWNRGKAPQTPVTHATVQHATLSRPLSLRLVDRQDMGPFIDVPGTPASSPKLRPSSYISPFSSPRSRISTRKSP